MDNLLLASDSLDDLKQISCESTSLFESRGFKLRKSVANGSSKTALAEIPKCDLSSNIQEIKFKCRAYARLKNTWTGVGR